MVDGPPVDLVQRRQRIDQRVKQRSPICAVHLCHCRIGNDAAIDKRHHEEFRPDHIRIVTQGDHARHRHGCIGKGLYHAMLAVYLMGLG